MTTTTWAPVVLMASASIYWHLPIVIVVISLVYSATRFDEWPYILRETVRWVMRMAAFLVMIGAVLWVISMRI